MHLAKVINLVHWSKLRLEDFIIEVINLWKFIYRGFVVYYKEKRR